MVSTDTGPSSGSKPVPAEPASTTGTYVARSDACPERWHDTSDVDTFLERIAASMDAHAAGHVGPDTLTADDVLNARFGATKFRDGYDQDEVDDFLDTVVTALRARAAAGALRGSPVDGGSGTGILAAAAEASGAWLRAASSDLAPLRLAPGYSVPEVDALLQRAAEALDRRAPGGRALLSAEDVRETRFSATWWRPGYPRHDIDSLMEAVISALST